MVHKIVPRNIHDSRFIELVEDEGNLIRTYPVDESQTISNAGDAEVYKYKGRTWEIITWNELAMDHLNGEKEIKDITDEFYGS